MKSLLFFLGLSFPLLKASNLTCHSSSLSFDATFENIDFSFSSDSSTACFNDETCGIAKYDIDVSVTTNSTKFWALLYKALFGDKITESIKLNYETCVDVDTCNLLTGGSNNCRETQFIFNDWFPTSCSEADNYDAVVISYNATYDYACCSSNNCNNDSFDFTKCEKDTAFTNYVSELYDCWNDVKKTFMKYLICDNNGSDIYNFVKSCYSDGDYNWNNASCYYYLTCSSELQSYLTEFGNCACQAATDNGYSGVLLAELLETQWSTYCPNINLECSNDGALDAYLLYYYVHYRFYLDLAYEKVTTDVQNAIIAAIAKAANCDSSVITITVTSNSANSTEITIDVQTQSSTDQSNVQSSISKNGDTKVSSATGATVSSSQTSTSSSSTQLTPTSSANSLNIQFGLFVVIIFSSILSFF